MWNHITMRAKCELGLVWFIRNFICSRQAHEFVDLVYFSLVRVYVSGEYCMFWNFFCEKENCVELVCIRFGVFFFFERDDF